MKHLPYCQVLYARELVRGRAARVTGANWGNRDVKLFSTFVFFRKGTCTSHWGGPPSCLLRRGFRCGHPEVNCLRHRHSSLTDPFQFKKSLRRLPEAMAFKNPQNFSATHAASHGLEESAELPPGSTLLVQS